jgi:hypothetical protein
MARSGREDEGELFRSSIDPAIDGVKPHRQIGAFFQHQEDDMAGIWIRIRVWLANRLLGLGLIEAAKWVAPKRWGRP